MQESRRKVKSKEILADIRAGMEEPELMDKHGLSPRQLQAFFRKLSEAGLIEYPRPAGEIPEDHALVPVEKEAREVPRDSDERRRLLRRLRGEERERQEHDKVLRILESTFHWHLLGVGAVMFFVGVGLYVMWPYIETRWLGDLALDRTLGHQGSTERTYEIWHYVSTKGGPVMALVGGLLAAAGMIKRWLNNRRIERMVVRQRQGLVFEPAREEQR
ncbi:MAG: hypothetical protein V1792_16870 [Pseudomonadota bacterium]